MFQKILSITACLTIIFSSCNKDDMKNYYDLSNLPTDEGGSHKAVYLGTDEAEYGYYIYQPSVSYPKYPLLLFLHGAGERGNSIDDPELLDIVIRNGLPMLIEKKQWNPKYPMIVVSPQSEGNWEPFKLHKFIKYLLSKYNINEKRIYITGLSMGGFGTFNYLSYTGDSCYAAAAVPICGGGNTNKVSEMKHIPLWAFHGSDDKVVLPEKSISMINAINAQNPPVKAKLTIYPGVAHNSWSKTYDGTGMGTEDTNYDEFTMQVYDWMFQYEWHQFYQK